MAFSSSLTERNVEGNKAINMGTYVSTGGSTGGDIITGLSKCEQLFLQAHGDAVTALAAVNEVVTPLGIAYTIVTEANGTGGWMAIGT